MKPSESTNKISRGPGDFSCNSAPTSLGFGTSLLSIETNQEGPSCTSSVSYTPQDFNIAVALERLPSHKKESSLPPSDDHHICCCIIIGWKWTYIYIYGCFLKWWYPQNTPKWSFLVGKPMVVGYHHFRKPPYVNVIYAQFKVLFFWNRWFPAHLKPDFHRSSAPVHGFSNKKKTSRILPAAGKHHVLFVYIYIYFFLLPFPLPMGLCFFKCWNVSFPTGHGYHLLCKLPPGICRSCPWKRSPPGGNLVAWKEGQTPSGLPQHISLYHVC